MVSTDYPGAVMSDITLALFDATGYYKTKPYSGGLFKFGKNKGCDFLDKKCIESGKPISEDEFCITPYEPKCSNARNMKLSCYLEDYSKYGYTAESPLACYAHHRIPGGITLGVYECTGFVRSICIFDIYCDVCLPCRCNSLLVENVCTKVKRSRTSTMIL